MIKKLFLIFTLVLYASSYAIANECVDNTSVGLEYLNMVENVRPGQWQIQFNIEMLEDGAHTTIFTHRKRTPSKPNEINYFTATFYGYDPYGKDDIFMHIEYQTALQTIIYNRQLISYDAKTHKSIWNNRCLNKTIVKH